MRVALDLLGGVHAPGGVVDGALLVSTRRPDIDVVLVGPPDVAAAVMADRRVSDRLEVVAAHQVIAGDDDPARAVRARRDATVRVAARLVRDGAADAMVSLGAPGATTAAAMFTLGRLPGVSRPALAAVVPAAAGGLVLLDVSGSVDCTADRLSQLALAGAALARTRLGLPSPAVGLLNVGPGAGAGDALRREAYDALSALPVRFVGNVRGDDAVLGGAADVVVTDGFTGSVLAHAVAGAARRGHDDPDEWGGGVLLGVDGVVVAGDGAASPVAVEHCVYAAARAVADGLVGELRGVLGSFAAARRVTAGMEVGSP